MQFCYLLVTFLGLDRILKVMQTFSDSKLFNISF